MCLHVALALALVTRTHPPNLLLRYECLYLVELNLRELAFALDRKRFFEVLHVCHTQRTHPQTNIPSLINKGIAWHTSREVCLIFNISCVCVKTQSEIVGRGVESTDLALQVWHPRRCVGPHGIVGRHYYLCCATKVANDEKGVVLERS